MLVDLFAETNWGKYNKVLAKELQSVTNAVYLDELLSLWRKATNEHKLVGDYYLKVNRNYIKNNLYLSPTEQKGIEGIFKKLGIIDEINVDDDLIHLNVNQVINLITLGENVEFVNGLNEIVIDYGKRAKENREKKKEQGVYQNLMECLNVAEMPSELAESYGKLVGTLLGKFGKKVITKDLLIQFKKDLNDFTKDDAVKIKVLEIANAYGYKVCPYAIKLFREKYPQGLGNKNSKATKLDVAIF